MSYDVRSTLAANNAGPAGKNKLRLFTSPSAVPNPQRLRLFIHEKGVADRFEEIVYDMAPGGQQC